MTSLLIIKTKLKALASRQGLRKYLANTSWLMVERIFRMVVMLFVGIYIARYLGPENFGLLSYALSFSGLFLALATLGLDGIVVRELVKEPEQRDKLLGTAFWLKLGGTAIMWIMITAVAPVMGHDTQTNILIAICALAAVFQAFNVIDFNFQAEVRSRYVVHAQLIQLVISSTVKLIFIAIEAPLAWFAWAFCLDALLLASGLVVMYWRKSGNPFYWKWNLQIAAKLLRNCWPLILSGVVISIYMKIDQVMINTMMGADAVGIYAAAVRLSEAWYFIPVVITSSVFPAIISSKGQDETRYYQQLKKLYNLMAWLAITIALPTSVLAPWIIEILYGAAYAGAASVLAIHIWAGVFVFIGVASGKWLLNENLQIYTMINTSIGAVANVTLNYYLIPLHGITGAATATLVSFAIAGYLSHALFGKTRGNFIRLTNSLFPIRMLNVKGNR